MRWALLILVVASCGSTDSVEKQRVASVSFDVYSGWHRRDFDQRGRQTAEWQPDDNDRHEALTVIRTELSPQIARADVAYLSGVLAQSQSSLPQSHIDAVSAITTSKGLSGVRASVDFRPPGTTAVYHRVHVVLVDGDALINVLYTARQPNPRALDLVLSSIQHEEG